MRTATLADDLVVLDRRAGATHVFNRSAATVWAALGEGGTVVEVVGRVAATVGVAPERVAADVGRTLRDLVALGLVAAADEGGAADPAGPVTGPAAFRPGGDGSGDGALVIASVVAAGTTVVLWSGDPDVRRALAAATDVLPRAERADHRIEVSGPERGAGGDGGPAYRVVVDGQEAASVWTAGDAVDRALAALNALAIAGTPGRVLVHGGAVERDGRVVVVAGASGRGKSTATAALVEAGFAYLTDELVVVDPGDLAVTPYAKAVDLGAASRELLGLGGSGSPGKEPVAPSRLGRVSPGGRLATLVLLDDGPPDPARLEPLDALLELLPNVFDPSFDRTEGLEDLAHLVHAVPVHRLGRAAPAQLVATIASLVG